jgi:predicted AAA+ superfamily ATPase
MLRQLQPWHANLEKRQVKSPKVYFRDTGLLHYLLGVRNEKELWTSSVRLIWCDCAARPMLTIVSRASWVSTI